jgi:hypothetical protein
MIKNIKKLKKNIGNITHLKKLSNNKKNKINRIDKIYFLILFAIIINITFVVNEFFKIIEKKSAEYKQISNNISSDFEGFLNYSQLLLNSVNHEIAKSKSFGDQTVDILSSINRIRNQNNIANQMFFEGMLYWIDSNKYLIASSAGKVLKPIDLSSRDYLEKTQLIPWKLQVGKSVIGALSGQNILPFAVGAFGENGHHIGTSVLSVKIENIINKFSISSSDKNGNFIIFNNEKKSIIEYGKDITENDLNIINKISKNIDESNELKFHFNIFDKNDFFITYSKTLEYPYIVAYFVKNNVIYSEFIFETFPYLIQIIFLIFLLKLYNNKTINNYKKNY